jgi:hypothetical protein
MSKHKPFGQSTLDDLFDSSAVAEQDEDEFDPAPPYQDESSLAPDEFLIPRCQQIAKTERALLLSYCTPLLNRPATKEEIACGSHVFVKQWFPLSHIRSKEILDPNGGDPLLKIVCTKWIAAQKGLIEQ